MGKRANGEGLLRQRPDGSWECRITHEDPNTGQRQRLSFYAPTAKAARAKAKKAQERIDAGERATERVESTLVGRRWEMFAVDDLLERAVAGHGAVVGVVGPPGIGKSRLVREVTAVARRRGVDVFSVFCESHTSQVPFHAVARLLRAATGVEGLDGQIARDQVSNGLPDADPEDLALFDELLGIGDPNTLYRPSIRMPVGGG